MFGFFKRKPAQPETQIPYEVYETVQQPSIQRRRWIIRLVAALIAVTLLIFGFMALSRALLNNDDQSGNNTTQQGQGNNNPSPTPAGKDIQPPDNLKQSPKQNPGLPSADANKPTTTPQSNETSGGTVRKPE